MTTAKRADDTLSVEDETEAIGHDTPALFVCFCCERPMAPGYRFNLDGIESVLFGRADALPRVERDCLHLSLSDPRMSVSHAVLRRTTRGFVLRDLQSKNGSFVNGDRVGETVLDDGDLIELGGTFLVFRNVGDTETGPSRSLLGVETLLPQFASELSVALDIARSDVPLVLLGETGTGKEVVARAAHAESGRPGSMIAVNCAALPVSLVESELFGSKKGAFSGADTDRSGLIAAAHKGTLFLDEIGELPMPAQAALLRVLQDGEVTPLGATKPIACDIRLISATNRDLSAFVDSGRFRADLYARLSGFRLRLWPLRDRKEDLGLLIASLLRRLAENRASTISFSVAAVRRLFQYSWPLNIRELEKTLSAAVVLRIDQIKSAHLQLASVTTEPPTPSPSTLKASPEHEARRQQLRELLLRYDGNVSAVAREMGKARVQIRRWIRMYRLDRKR